MIVFIRKYKDYIKGARVEKEKFEKEELNFLFKTKTVVEVVGITADIKEVDEKVLAGLESEIKALEEKLATVPTAEQMKALEDENTELKEKLAAAPTAEQVKALEEEIKKLKKK